jgi:histidyl-tRNA synthetase
VADLVQPRTLSGFRDYPPDLMIPRERVLETARKVYRSYGFSPIDTPAAEALDVLLGKGGGENDRLVYRVKSAKSDVEEMGLRFDLTVPFARFSAQHINKLGTPFKRYAMGPVWRGERPGHGRYREFWQCDFDTIGTAGIPRGPGGPPLIPNAADIETVLVICDLFDGLGFGGKYEIRINDRVLLDGFLRPIINFKLELVTPILRVLDKLSKIGKDGVIQELLKIPDITQQQVDTILNMLMLKGTNAEILNKLRDLHFYAACKLQFPAYPTFLSADANLRGIIAACSATGISEDRIKIDLSICRGLDYYTGTIYETFLTDLPGIGSVCSGGRYDNLASLYTKQVLPGVGASLGVDRLLAAMEELKHPWMTGATTPAKVICFNLDAKYVGQYQKVARELRAAGIGVEVFPDAKNPGPQFGYAERRGFRLALIAGEIEFIKGIWKVKDLAKREEVEVPAKELVEKVKALLPE